MSRKPYGNSKTADKRVTGRALQTRNSRVKLRDQYTCQECRRLFLPDELQIDHKVTLAAGGTESDDNLQSLCEPCHEAKSLRERGCKPKIGCGIDGYPQEGAW